MLSYAWKGDYREVLGLGLEDDAVKLKKWPQVIEYDSDDSPATRDVRDRLRYEMQKAESEDDSDYGDEEFGEDIDSDSDSGSDQDSHHGPPGKIYDQVSAQNIMSGGDYSKLTKSLADHYRRNRELDA